ncbi:hypothetical protein HY771_03960 [Candidatus Uhrbacteria bacterium]|nr:hypothetical protein [Candidatus Uhrbacteria bacterium]
MNSPETQKSFTIRIPSFHFPSLQQSILVLLIIVGLLQTVQLLALDRQIATASASSASPTSSASPASSSSSVTSSLPKMVGGC